MTDSIRPTGLSVVAWKPMLRNTLRGFVDIRLPNGLLIHDIAIHLANGRAWASLPSKPVMAAGGEPKRDPATNKIRYMPVIEWSDRAVADRFSVAVIDAVELLHPGAVRS